MRTAPHENLMRFLYDYQMARAKGAFVRRIYHMVFKQPPPKGKAYPLLRVKIAYELQMRHFKLHGFPSPMPKFLKRNYRASQRMQLSYFDPEMHWSLKREIAGIRKGPPRRRRRANDGGRRRQAGEAQPA